MWQEGNDTDFSFIKVLFYFIFKHQCHPLQSSSLGQLQTDGDVVATFGSSAGSLPHFRSTELLEDTDLRAALPRNRLEDHIRVHLKEIGINSRNCVESVQNRDYCECGIELPGSVSYGVS